MALLADEDDSYDLDPVVILRSSTNEPLVDEDVSDFQLHRPKDKKDKKSKLDDKRGSSRNLPWAKQKDNTLEKTPKKSKHNRNKSASRTPPDSPKAGRLDDSKKQLRGGTAPATQPSPNMKGHRKSYSQLGGMGDSSDEECSEGEGTGYLLSNHPALEQEEHKHTNPWVSVDDKPSSPKSQTQFQNLFVDPADTKETTSEPWWPTTDPSLTRRATVQFPVLFGSQEHKTQTEKTNIATSPDRLHPAHDGRGSLPTIQNPHMQGEAASPIRERQQQPHPLFFQSPYQPATTLPPPPQPLAPPPSQLTHTVVEPPVPIATSIPSPLSEPDWSISEELREKCVSQFTDLSPSNGLLQGDKARAFFVLSKLPNHELSAIWRLADIDKDNALSEYEFCVAMKLVMMRRKGIEIPNSLPPMLLPNTNLPRTFSDNFWSTTDTPTSTQPTNLPAPPSQPRFTQPALSGDDEEGQEERLEDEEDVTIVNSPLSSLVAMNAVDDEVLVDISDLGDEDTGILVDIGDQKDESQARPTLRTTSLEPTIARIISLDGDPGDWDEHTDDTALVKRHRKTGSEGSINEKNIPREKPARPAPPKPRVQRSKTLKATSNRSEVQRSSGVTTPPGIGRSMVKTDDEPFLVVNIDKGTPQQARRGSKQSRRDYTTLDSSDSSPTEPLPPNGDDKEGFQWKQFSDNSLPGLEASVIEERRRGHNRGKSVDLNKMIEADKKNDVLDDLPSAVPPKPPPKPHHSPPPDLVREEGKTRPTISHSDMTDEEDRKKSVRGRSLSTGSITKPVFPETDLHHNVELETNALLLSNQGPPKAKSRKLKVAPRRPPPPIKPTKPDLSDYQVSDTKATMKDKKELQSTIKSLKEQNSLLTEVNQNLETKLFQLIEERVKLERELDMNR